MSDKHERLCPYPCGFDQNGNPYGFEDDNNSDFSFAELIINLNK